MNELGTPGTELRWQHNVIQIRYWPAPADAELEPDEEWETEPVVIGATEAQFAADGPDGHITFHEGKPAYRGRVEFILDTNVATTAIQFRGVSALQELDEATTITKMEHPNLMCDQTEALSADPEIVAKCAELSRQDAERAQDAKMRAYAASQRSVCDRPPPGWRCTRAAGHEGPCAAVAVASGPQVSLFSISNGQKFMHEGLIYKRIAACPEKMVD
jgi:hypothetical protein